MSDSPGLDPELFASADMHAAITKRDIATVYRLLNKAGIAQRTIAAATGQSQSEVSDILHKGRQVMAYDVLVRICTGLVIPRGMMGLAYDGDIEPVVEPAAEPVGEMDENMKRRALLAVGAVSLLGAPVLGEVLHIPVRPDVPTPLPARLGASDLSAIKSLTAELRTVARAYGGCAETVTGVAQRSLALMSVPASDVVRAGLGSALADLHNVAGWCCVDSGLHDNARAHFATAMDLAAESGDACQFASALWHAGIHMRDAEAYNDDLTACQLGLFKLSGSPDSPGAAEAMAWLLAESALALAAMGHREAAESAIRKAREHRMSSVFDEADLDYGTSNVYRHLGRLDIAEQYAGLSVRRWKVEGTSRRDSVLPDIALAVIHVTAGEPAGTALAHRAITSVAELRSVRARMGLGRLVEALETRPRSDNRELAHRARQVASVRA